MTTLFSSTLSSSVFPESFKFKVLYAALLSLGMLCLLAYHPNEFSGQHSPLIQAPFHNGEISDVSDGEYVGKKLGNDIASLEADIQSKEWPGIRTEVLSREPYLFSIYVQNDKLQRRIVLERNANLGANDVCEQLALEELGPGLNAYTAATNNLFTFMKANTELTTANIAIATYLTDSDQRAMQQLQRYFSDRKNHSCK